jgi:hypothetical protein
VQCARGGGRLRSTEVVEHRPDERQAAVAIVVGSQQINLPDQNKLELRTRQGHACLCNHAHGVCVIVLAVK